MDYSNSALCTKVSRGNYKLRLHFSGQHYQHFGYFDKPLDGISIYFTDYYLEIYYMYLENTQIKTSKCFKKGVRSKKETTQIYIKKK